MADAFKKYESLFTTTSNTFSTGSDVEITLNSATGLPTDTEITLTFDRVDSSGTATPALLERITGTISDVTFTVVTRGADGTTEQSHTSPVVEQVWNSADWNSMVTGLLVEHSQAGAHTDITATSATISGAATASTVNIGSTIAVSGVLDSDAMTGATDLNLSTSESIKAYADSLITALTSASSVATTGTPTPVGSTKTNEFTITALAEATEMAEPSGTPVHGNRLLFTILDDGTARAITYNAIYAAGGVDLPDTTTISKTLRILFIYNSENSKWDCVASTEEA